MTALPSIPAAQDRVIGPVNLYSRLAEVALRHAGGGSSGWVSLKPMAERRPASGQSGSLTMALGEQVNNVGDIPVRRSMD